MARSYSILETTVENFVIVDASIYMQPQISAFIFDSVEPSILVTEY